MSGKPKQLKFKIVKKTVLNYKNKDNDDAALKLSSSELCSRNTSSNHLFPSPSQNNQGDSSFESSDFQIYDLEFQKSENSEARSRSFSAARHGISKSTFHQPFAASTINENNEMIERRLKLILSKYKDNLENTDPAVFLSKSASSFQHKTIEMSESYNQLDRRINNHLSNSLYTDRASSAFEDPDSIFQSIKSRYGISTEENNQLDNIPYIPLNDRFIPKAPPKSVNAPLKPSDLTDTSPELIEEKEIKARDISLQTEFINSLTRENSAICEAPIHTSQVVLKGASDKLKLADLTSSTTSENQPVFGKCGNVENTPIREFERPLCQKKQVKDEGFVELKEEMKQFVNTLVSQIMATPKSDEGDLKDIPTAPENEKSCTNTLSLKESRILVLPKNSITQFADPPLQTRGLSRDSSTQCDDAKQVDIGTNTSAPLSEQIHVGTNTYTASATTGTQVETRYAAECISVFCQTNNDISPLHPKPEFTSQSSQTECTSFKFASKPVGSVLAALRAEHERCQVKIE